MDENRKVLEALVESYHGEVLVDRILAAGFRLPNTPTGIHPDKMGKVRLMLEDGASYREIGRTLHVNADAVRRLFPGHGWTQVQAGQYSGMRRKENEWERKHSEYRR